MPPHVLSRYPVPEEAVEDEVSSLGSDGSDAGLQAVRLQRSGSKVDKVPHNPLCSWHSWRTLWRHLIVYGAWAAVMVLLAGSESPLAPPLMLAVFTAGHVLAFFTPMPGRTMWLLLLPCSFFCWSFPLSYSWLWAVLAPLPPGPLVRQCSPEEYFGRLGGLSYGPPAPTFNSPYRRGECADPVCGFLMAKQAAGERRFWPLPHGGVLPVLVSGEGNVTGILSLPEACQFVIRTDSEGGPASKECEVYCARLLGHDQRWRLLVHFLIPFCSGVAGWGLHGGGAAYEACGQNVFAFMPGPKLMCSFALIYSMPLLAALVYYFCKFGSKKTALGGESFAGWGPSPSACLPDGRFPGGRMYFPYSFIRVSSDAQGERVSFLLEALWVVPDVPMDLLTCLLFLSAGEVHRASLVFFAIVASGDPFQIKGAVALASRRRRSYPARSWWKYRAKEGYCESGLTLAMSVWSFSTAMPGSAKGSLGHTMVFLFSAGTSLLAVSAGSEAHALLHLSRHSSLQLRDYYSVMRAKKQLGMVRIAGMVRILHATWVIAILQVTGRPELVGLNLAIVLFEALAMEWEYHTYMSGVSRVTRSCRYICTFISALNTVKEAIWRRELLLDDFTVLLDWSDSTNIVISLLRAAFLLLLGPVVFLASPVTDVLSHRAVSKTLASWQPADFEKEDDVSLDDDSDGDWEVDWETEVQTEVGSYGPSSSRYTESSHEPQSSRYTESHGLVSSRYTESAATESISTV